MIGFNKALKDGSDPSYAPGLSWSKRNASWKAPKKYVEAGYLPARVNLNLPGHKEDDHQIERAKACRALTRAMLEWWETQDQSGWDIESISYVIHRFMTDDASPFASVKGNTQADYRYRCDYWNGAIGHMKLKSLDFFEIRGIEKTMREKGRSVAFIHRMFTMLRGLASYGKLLKVKGAAELKETLAEMRFQAPPKVSSKPTRDQVMAVVKQADAAGDKAFAAGLLIQWEFALRAVDVRGQWFDITEDEFKMGGIVRKTTKRVNGVQRIIYSRWQDGLCIEHFDDQMNSFRKVISKTEKSQPEPLTFPITGLPELRNRLIDLRGERRMGPMIITGRHGLPFDHTAYTSIWRKHARAAGVDTSKIKLKDVRAGALSEAEAMGADPRLLQAAGQHSSFATTERYLRNKDERVAQVIELRIAGRNL